MGSAFVSWEVLSPWETATAAGTYLRPCGNVPISDSWQGHKNRSPTSAEPGTDYSVDSETPVVAAADGVIVDRKDTTSTATGRYLALQADDGNYIRYLHLDSSAVPVGTRVARGQVIAYSGASGFDKDYYYGPHVHVSLWIGGSPFQLGFKNSVDFENYIGGAAPTQPAEPEDPVPYYSHKQATAPLNYVANTAYFATFNGVVTTTASPGDTNLAAGGAGVYDLDIPLHFTGLYAGESVTVNLVVQEVATGGVSSWYPETFEGNESGELRVSHSTKLAVGADRRLLLRIVPTSNVRLELWGRALTNFQA